MTTTTAFIGAKGGSGTTITAVAYALSVAKAPAQRVLLIDATGTGDCAAALGLATGPTLGERVTATPDLDLVRCVPIHRELLAAVNVAELSDPSYTAVVIDGGLLGSPAEAFTADRWFLVLSGCYLGLRRSVRAELGQCAGAVVIEHPGRAIGAREIDDVLSLRVIARIPARESIARAVDAGVLAARVPDVLARPMGDIHRRMAEA